MASAATLLAAYGEVGRKGVSSFIGRSSGDTDPYTSAELTTSTRAEE